MRPEGVNAGASGLISWTTNPPRTVRVPGGRGVPSVELVLCGGSSARYAVCVS